MVTVKIGVVGCGFVAHLHMYAYKRVYGLDTEVKAVEHEVTTLLILSYGASRTDAYRRAGVYVGRVLKGGSMSAMPPIATNLVCRSECGDGPIADLGLVYVQNLAPAE